MEAVPNIPPDGLVGVIPGTVLRRGETHDPVHCNFMNLMKFKLLNEGTLIFWYQHQLISCFDVVLVMK